MIANKKSLIALDVEAGFPSRRDSEIQVDKVERKDSVEVLEEQQQQSGFGGVATAWIVGVIFLGGLIIFGVWAAVHYTSTDGGTGTASKNRLGAGKEVKCFWKGSKKSFRPEKIGSWAPIVTETSRDVKKPSSETCMDVKKGDYCLLGCPSGNTRKGNLDPDFRFPLVCQKDGSWAPPATASLTDNTCVPDGGKDVKKCFWNKKSLRPENIDGWVPYGKKLSGVKEKYVYTCGGVPDGETCLLRCPSGFTNVGLSNIQLFCLKGVWKPTEDWAHHWHDSVLTKNTCVKDKDKPQTTCSYTGNKLPDKIGSWTPKGSGSDPPATSCNKVEHGKICILHCPYDKDAGEIDMKCQPQADGSLKWVPLRKLTENPCKPNLTESGHPCFVKNSEGQNIPPGSGWKCKIQPGGGPPGVQSGETCSFPKAQVQVTKDGKNGWSSLCPTGTVPYTQWPGAPSKPLIKAMCVDGHCSVDDVLHGKSLDIKCQKSD